jgi:hypothetical protein
LQDGHKEDEDQRSRIAQHMDHFLFYQCSKASHQILL